MTTIEEEFTLPSLGKVYNKKVNPHIKLRSMTTEDEMVRLSPVTDRMYKPICDMIDNCIVGEKPGISVYDMCMADYLFLYHKIRVVTYGTDYSVQCRCPVCQSVNVEDINLDDLEVKEYSEEMEKHFDFTLPKSKNIIHLKLQSPHSADDIDVKVRSLKRKNPQASDSLKIVYGVMALIDTVDGQVLTDTKLETFVRHLPMADTNCIIKHAEVLSESFGIDTNLYMVCKECGNTYVAPFRYGTDFFRPTINY